MKNPTVKKTIKVVTIAGSAVLVVGAGMTLISAKSVKEAVMPMVAILVGLAAFNYAMNDKVEVVVNK
jgi:VIT1/CCC1 family predicted Fe2+/Mn2+ transporter